MRRALVVTALAVLVVAVVSAEAQTLSFRFGVAAGEVTSTTATLWTKAASTANVRVELSLGSRIVATRAARPLRANDLTVQFRMTGLVPGRRYAYRFRQGSALSASGAFETAPRPSAGASVRFAISGDADATPTESGGLAFNRFQIYARMAAERNDFNINLGDTIYSDSGVGGRPAARTTAEKWSKYKLGLALAAATHPPRVHRPLQPLGRSRVRQRLLPVRARSGDLRRRCQGVPRLLARHLQPRARSLPPRPLGQAPRALLPRRALVPQRESDLGLRQRPCPHGPATGEGRLREPRARAEESRAARVSRGDQRPGSDDARRPPVRARSRARSRPRTRPGRSS